MGLPVIRLRQRNGQLPTWARWTTQFALTFLLLAVCKAALPTVCVSLSGALDTRACCAKSHHHHVQEPQPARSFAEGLHANQDTDPALDATPCAFCSLMRGLVEMPRFASAPAPLLEANAALPPAEHAPQSSVPTQRTNPLRGPPYATA
jgi:hypothetical protein